MTVPPDRTVLALCADLLFAARIRGVAEQVGVPVVTLTGGRDVVSRLRAQPPVRLLLDLDARWLDGVGLLRELKADAALRSIDVVAFVSHVREAAIAEARAAGADRVLARSAFVRQLPALLRGDEAA